MLQRVLLVASGEDLAMQQPIRLVHRTDTGKSGGF